MRADTQTGLTTALPVVMLPGTLCDARIFGPLRHRLAPLATQVIVPRNARSLEQAAEEVLAQAPRQFVLLGFSLGGMVAMEAALLAPDRVRALVLLSTTPLAVPAERHPARLALVDVARTLSMRQFVREHLWPEYGGRADDAYTLPLLEQMAQELGCESFALQTEMALRRADFSPRLKAVSCPVLIVAGTEDVLCPPSAQGQLAASLPDSSSVMLPGAGHFAVLEQPDEVAVAVAAWLHRCNAAQHAADRPARRSDGESE